MLNNVEKINEALLKEYKSDNNWKFPKDNEDCKFIKEEINVFYNSLIKKINVHFVDFFEDLSIYSLDKTIYSLVHIKDKKKSQQELSEASMYGYNAIHYGNKMCTCFPSNPSLEMHRSVILWATTIISKHWDEAYKIGNDLIASVNAEKCIIKRGDSEAHSAWFLLELYTFISDKVIDKRKALYPDKLYPYDEVLKNWDTKDLKEVDKLAYLLSDAHLMVNDKNHNLLKMSFIQIFPYEIIAWLSIRDKMGLKNPTAFTHPLMNTQIAKMFLDIKEPLKKPKELPFSDELIAKLKEKYPDKEIEKQESISTLKEKTTPPKSLAPKTGRYRATLPNTHAQANQLEGDPHSYARFKKDDTFTYEGLEDYDLSEITWIFTGAT